MNITNIQNQTIRKVAMQVDYSGSKYDVVIYLDEKGRFIDEEVSSAASGADADEDIKEDITDYLAHNWDEKVGI